MSIIPAYCCGPVALWSRGAWSRGPIAVEAAVSSVLLNAKPF